jgi:hypothetical protein
VEDTASSDARRTSYASLWRVWTTEKTSPSEPARARRKVVAFACSLTVPKIAPSAPMVRLHVNHRPSVTPSSWMDA